MLYFLFLLNLINFFLKIDSFINILLSFEFLIISLCLCLFWNKINIIIIIMFLFMSVMEAVLGLSILIFLVRKNSNDKISSFFF